MKILKNSKIIGFTVSLTKINHKDIDIFKRGLFVKEIKHEKFFLYIWGIGDLDSCFIRHNCFSLSFPLHNSLLDRNVRVTLEKNQVVIENDWLGSIPVFYNTKTKTVSTLINKVVSGKREIDADGLNNYLNFGFSVFGQTPAENVHFMRYYASLVVTSFDLKEVYKNDFVTFKDSKNTSEKAIKKIKSYINNQEKKINKKQKKIKGNITIPTSGGYDSRLLNYLVSNKERVRSYTYGVSKKQSQSAEVIKAKKLSELLGIKWKRIELRSFNKYFKEWFFLYGVSVHLHGMYHIEFFKKITKSLGADPGTLLSGFFGDVWSGNVTIDEIKTVDDLIRLGYTHDIRLDPKYSKLKKIKNLDTIFLKNQRKNFKDHKLRIVAAIRLKIILISYLICLPDYFALPGWTPFLNYDVVKGVLSIDEKSWKNRIWLVEYFKEKQINLEDYKLEYDEENCLEYEGLKNSQIDPIKKTSLVQLFSQEFINKVINNYTNLCRLAETKKDPIQLKFHKVYYMFKKSPYSFMKWYVYITLLKNIEMFIQKN